MCLSASVLVVDNDYSIAYVMSVIGTFTHAINYFIDVTAPITAFNRFFDAPSID